MKEKQALYFRRKCEQFLDNIDKLVNDQITPVNVKDVLQGKGWNDTISFGIIRDGDAKMLHIWRGGLMGPDGNVRPAATAPQGSGARGASSDASSAPQAPTGDGVPGPPQAKEMVVGTAKSSTVVVSRSPNGSPRKDVVTSEMTTPPAPAEDARVASAGTRSAPGSSQKFISFESAGPKT